LPGLRHDISLLADESCLKGMVDRLLTCPEVAALDSLVDGSPNGLGNPDIHLPVAPLTAGFPEALNALDSLHVRHGTSPTALKT
jgi:hypothetical protein